MERRYQEFCRLTPLSFVTSVSDTSGTIATAVPPSGTSVQYTTTASYDPLNRPATFIWTPATSAATPATSSVTFTHTYNSVNQRTSQATTDNSWWYYPSGTSTITYTANALNQYTSVGAVTPTYDANGTSLQTARLRMAAMPRTDSSQRLGQATR